MLLYFFHRHQNIPRQSQLTEEKEDLTFGMYWYSGRQNHLIRLIEVEEDLLVIVHSIIPIKENDGTLIKQLLPISMI